MEMIEQALNTLASYAVTIAGRLLFAVIVYIIGRQIVKFLKRAFAKSHMASGMNESAAGFISSCINVIGNLVLILTVASILGVPMTSIIALLGSAGLAVGLALQGGLSNFAGGIMILIFKPFEVGDYIVTGDAEGTVTKVSVFYTTLTTPDNKRIVVPNSAVTGSTVTNVSVEGERRVDIPFSVPAGTDVEKVGVVLTELAKEDDRVTDREAPATYVVGYGSGSYNFELRVWCHPDNYWPLRLDLIKKIPDRLAENDIALAKTAMEVKTK